MQVPCLVYAVTIGKALRKDVPERPSGWLSSAKSLKVVCLASATAPDLPMLLPSPILSFADPYIGINTDTISDLSFTCVVIELVVGRLDRSGLSNCP